MLFVDWCRAAKRRLLGFYVLGPPPAPTRPPPLVPAVDSPPPSRLGQPCRKFLAGDGGGCLVCQFGEAVHREAVQGDRAEWLREWSRMRVVDVVEVERAREDP